MQTDFYIDEQFLVKPGSNLIINGFTERVSHLDPSVMRVLCVLAQKAGKAVSREELFDSTWRDEKDPNAKLLQAIALLQEILTDGKKEFIRSDPSGSYLLDACTGNADIAELEREASAPSPNGSQAGGLKWITTLSMIIVLLLIFFVFYNYNCSSQPSSEPNRNEANVVISLGPDGIIYKLLMKDDQTIHFFINNIELPSDKWAPYQTLINSLKKQLKEKTGQASGN